MKKKGWFAEWFDTEYYHLLYRKRDDAEAARFLRSLIQFLNLDPHAKVADIACGKGRHSRVLAAMGFGVFGYDLSPNNIEYAQKHASGGEVFKVHDIRQPYSESDFQAAFNLFTSFGYFETKDEDLSALANIYHMLSPGGYLVQDYINASAVVKKLPAQHSETCSGIHFFIEKTWNPPFITKKITVDKNGDHQMFYEKVKVYKVEELSELHAQCGFEVIHTFGDYELGNYDVQHSSRIILISRKAPE